MSRSGNYTKALKKAQNQASVSDSSSVESSIIPVSTEQVQSSDPFLENLKLTNPEAYSTKHPTSGDTLYYIQQDGKWVQTW